MKFIFAITKGLIRDAAMRRKTMFGCVLAACAMVFAGASFLAQPLSENTRAFIFYWFACAWLTLTSVLLAIFDVLMLRAYRRSEEARLKKEIFGREDEQKNP